MVAALGMAVATDYWAIAIIMTVLTSGILLLLGPLSAWLAAKSEVRTIRREKHFRRMVEEGLRKGDPEN
jgi:uncharacterized membrane protein YhiD involved in acid resistance